MNLTEAKAAGVVSIDGQTYASLAEAAEAAQENDTVVVDGELEMTDPVVFDEKITLELTENVKITYESDNNSQIYLITLANGSMLDMADGASVAMIGDADTQNTGRDWRVVYSAGDLTVTQFAGEITVENARGRGIYANNDLIFDCPMAGKITMDNPNGENRYMYGIVSYAGDVEFAQGIAEGAEVMLYFGKGNSAYGIAAQQGAVTVIGDVAGKIDVQMGTSHAGVGIYAANSVTVTGDISGDIYARGGSGSGYGIYADKDISIAEISGLVTGDCYNEIMNNSQSGASALYAGGNIYGAEEDKPIELSGTLSSTVGRNDAFTVQAKGDVSIDVSGNGVIKAQSSYGADWTSVTGDDSKAPMTNNWGGAAAGVVAGGDIDISGNEDAIEVTSASENGTPVNSGFLAQTGKQENVNNISSFLYYVACDDTDNAKTAAEKLTSEDKEQINGYDEIVEDMFAVTVNSATDLQNAIDRGELVIKLGADITLDNMMTGISGKSLIIDGDKHTLSFNRGTGPNFNGVFGNDTAPLYAGTDLTVKNLTIKNTGTQAGYATIFGYNANGASVSYENCTFENLYAAVYVNPVTENPEKGGVDISIIDCVYKDTVYGYAIDETSEGYLLTDVKFEGNTGNFTQNESVATNVIYVQVDGYQKVFHDLQTAVEAADKNTVIEIAPGTYDGIISFAGKSVTIKAQYPAYQDGKLETDKEKLTNFTGSFSTQEDSNSSFPDQTVIIEGIAFSGDGLKVGTNHYNSVGNLEVRNCTMTAGHKSEPPPSQLFCKNQR